MGLTEYLPEPKDWSRWVDKHGIHQNYIFYDYVRNGAKTGYCSYRQKEVPIKSWKGDEQKTFHIGPPKTKSSVRNVPINRQCSLALKKQRMQKNVVAMKSPKKPLEGFENLLFTTKYNTPINAEIYCDAILRIVNEINLMRDVLEEFEVFSGHCFRHTFATRCFEAGIQPKTVRQYLGHANLQMTMDLYTHVLKVYKQNEMSKLENSLDAVMDVSDEMVEGRYQNALDNQNGVEHRVIYFDGVKAV